jgi:hypothetical protein
VKWTYLSRRADFDSPRTVEGAAELRRCAKKLDRRKRLSQQRERVRKTGKPGGSPEALPQTNRSLTVAAPNHSPTCLHGLPIRFDEAEV